MTKTTNKEWEEEFLSAWEKSYGRMIYGETGFLTKDLGTPFEIDKYLVKEFIQSLLDKQKEEILLTISNSYVNSIYTPISDCAKLWRNELIKKIKEM